jgi:PIN domain nuclease of toxin-antitoxin system
MRLLIDSHALLWWLEGGERLSAEAREAIMSRHNEVAVSVASLWELAIKQSLGKLRIEADLREHVRYNNFAELPVLGEHASAVRTLPRNHGDPFDRLLVAQARCEGLTLVTRDRRLASYDVPVLKA